MIRLSKMTVLMAALALIGLQAAAAGAAEWHTNGDKAFTSTNAGPIRLAIDSGGTTIVTQGCTSASVSGTLNGPTSTTTPWVNAATVTPVFTGCQVVAGSPYTLVCSSAELRANSYVGGATLATAGGGTTTGLLTNIDCRISVGTTTCSTLTGTLPVQYINPNPIPVGAGSLTLTSVGQSLTTHVIGAGCSGVFPNGVATVGKPIGGTGITDITYTVDGPNAPYIFRTP